MQYTKQDLTNAGIPHDVKIEDLYHEYKKGGLTTLPRSTLAATLRNKYPSIITLGDLFKSSPSTKAFQEFKKGILANASLICSVHEASSRITIVPSTAFETLEDGLRQFLSAYLRAKKDRATYMKIQIKAAEVYCTVLRRLFDEYALDNSRGRIAKDLGITTQNIDNKLKSAHEDFDKLFFQDETPDNIAVSKDLIERVREIKHRFIVPAHKNKLETLSGIKSPRILDLLALILGCRILETGVIVAPGGRSGYNIARYKGQVKRLLKDEGIPISLDDFRILLKKEFEDEELRQDLELYALGGQEFEILTDNATSIDRIAVRWEYLNDFTTEIIRILYDSNAWGVKNAMSPDDIRNAWEKRARHFGKKSSFHSHYNKHWRLCANRNGYVMLRRSKSDDGFLDGQTYVSRLLFDNPGWTKGDVLNQAVKDGYAFFYERSSLETYYSNAKEDHLVEDALVASVKILDYTAGNTLPFQSLLVQVNGKGIPILHGQLRKWIMRNKGTFSYTPVPGRKAVLVKLISKKAALLTSTSAWKAATAPAAVAVTAKTPVTSTVSSIDTGMASTAILSWVPETRLFPLLVANADKVFIIMKGGDTVFRDNNVFLSWLPGLNYYDSMTSWEKDSFRKSLLLTVQVFVSSFYQMKRKSDLCTDIMYDPSFTTVGPIGLGTMLKYLGFISLIPNAKVPHRPGTIEEAFCKASTAVVHARNNVGHPELMVNLKEDKISTQVHDALLLFLYLASRV